MKWRIISYFLLEASPFKHTEIVFKPHIFLCFSAQVQVQIQDA